MNDFSIVIPAYRATDTLIKLVEDSLSLFKDRLHKIILVFDCGREETWQTIGQLSVQYDRVFGVRLSRNFGQHNATICGFSYVETTFVVTMDEDMQHDPASIGLLFDQQAIADVDVVYGVYQERAHTWFRNSTSYLLNRLLQIGIADLHKDYTSFRLIRTKVAKETITMNNSYTFLDGYLTWITKSVSSVQVVHRPGQAGTSSYTLRKLLEHSINIFATFSNLPIRILVYAAIVFFVFSIGYSSYIIYNALFIQNYAAGFPTIIALLGFGFGFVLLGMGVLGEYIQRINTKTTKRPNYLVKMTTK